MGERRNAFRILGTKPEGKRLLKRPKCKWKNILDLGDIGWVSMDWICLAQDRVPWMALLNTVMNLGVHKNIVKF
jgi:hypothetical protein